MIYERILVEKERLDKELKAIQNQLTFLPPGKLICTRNANRYKWYNSDGRKQTYIPKKERYLAEQLAVKKYLMLLCEYLLQERRAIEFYLRHHADEQKQKHKKLLYSPAYRELLSPHFQPLSEELLHWMNAPYDHNPNYPEHLIHRTISGHLVRSKSEAMIACVLYMNKVPFRYESPFQSGQVTIYPDFTIRHPQTGSQFYWEHFGLMDDPSYCKQVFSKLNLYATEKIIPTQQLITTYETGKKPLSLEMVEKIVKEYFL